MKQINLGKLLLLMSLPFALSPASAGMPYVTKMACAIGEEKFDYTTTGSYTTFGSRPDGKPFGSWHFPLDLPECPKNGLIMFDEFSDEDKTKLKSLIVDERYTAMRKTETTYYRAMWLARELGRDKTVQLGLLRQAIWQTDDSPALRKRYFEEYLEVAPSLPEGSFSVEQLWTELSRANAERELGRFEAAKQKLDAIDLTRLVASKDDQEPLEAMKAYAESYRTKLRAVIIDGDSGLDPASMRSDRAA